MHHSIDRNANMETFICAVCGVKTYRKRIRTLPLDQFPFLQRQSRPGSKYLSWRNKYLAIVCLDCSETLWAQSVEYDRLGLPVDKRHFNWMALPPPPENSVEAFLARLPSGKKEVPRCPPIELPIGLVSSSNFNHVNTLSVSSSSEVMFSTKYYNKSELHEQPILTAQPEVKMNPRNTCIVSSTSSTITTICYPTSSCNVVTSFYHAPQNSNNYSANYADEQIDEMYVHKKRDWKVFVQSEDQSHSSACEISNGHGYMYGISNPMKNYLEVNFQPLELPLEIQYFLIGEHCSITC